MKVVKDGENTFSIKGLTLGKLHALVNVLDRATPATTLQQEVKEHLVADIKQLITEL